MRVLAGILTGIGITVGWLFSWRAFIGWALSRGD